MKILSAPTNQSDSIYPEEQQAELCFITPLNGVNTVVTTNHIISKEFGFNLGRVNNMINLAVKADKSLEKSMQVLDDGTDCIIISRDLFLQIPGTYSYIFRRFINAFDEVQQALDFMDKVVIQDESLAQAELDNLLSKYLSGVQLKELIKLQDDGVISSKYFLKNIYLAVNAGCIFIGDRCPLVNYAVIKKLKAAEQGISYFFTETRPSIVIRLYPSKLHDDNFSLITDTDF